MSRLFPTNLQMGGAITAAGLLVAVISAPATAQSVTYGELSAGWWQWAEENYSTPQGLDFDRFRCPRGQGGITWYLAGTSGGAAERTCNLPAGTHLFFPLVNAADFDDECGDEPCSVDEHREILDGLFSEEPAGIYNSVACDLVAELDGEPVVLSTPIVRTQSPPFSYADNPENLSDGFWVLLEPLPVGDHELYFAGGICDIDTGESLFGVELTYDITVADEER